MKRLNNIFIITLSIMLIATAAFAQFGGTQFNANVLNQYVQVQNDTDTAIGPNVPVVLDATKTLAGTIYSVKPTTKASDPLTVGVTTDTIGVGLKGKAIYFGIGGVDIKGSVTTGSAIGTSTTSAEAATSQTGVGVALENGTDEVVSTFIRIR